MCPKRRTMKDTHVQNEGLEDTRNQVISITSSCTLALFERMVATAYTGSRGCAAEVDYTFEQRHARTWRPDDDMLVLHHGACLNLITCQATLLPTVPAGAASGRCQCAAVLLVFKPLKHQLRTSLTRLVVFAHHNTISNSHWHDLNWRALLLDI